MGFNVVPQGYLAMDVRPTTEFEPLEDLGYSPASAALTLDGPAGWYKLGIIAGIAKEREETRAFGDEHEWSSMIGVVYAGPVIGFVGIDEELREIKRLLKQLRLYDFFAYEKGPKLDHIRRELAARGEIYNAITLMPNARPFDPDAVQAVRAILILASTTVEEIIPNYGLILSRHVKWAHPKVKGMDGAVKPRGPTVFGAGYRVWAVMGFPANYSIRHKTRTCFRRGRIKSVAEGLVEKLTDWRAWKAVRWGDDWLEEED